MHVAVHVNFLAFVFFAEKKETERAKGEGRGERGEGEQEKRERGGGGEFCVRELRETFVGCLMSQQHASVSQGRTCTDNVPCCHTEIQVAD